MITGCSFDSHDALWMRTGCALDARWMRIGCSLDAHWMLIGCSLDAPWILIRCSLVAHPMLIGCSLDAHKMLKYMSQIHFSLSGVLFFIFDESSILPLSVDNEPILQELDPFEHPSRCSLE